GTRLDLLVANGLGMSRNQAATLISEGAVHVAGGREKAGYRVRPGEEVVVDVPQPPGREVLGESIPLEVVFEDEHLVVVNKAAGMVVHPAAGVRTGTLANALAFRFRDSEIGSQQSIRPGIVHRLDRDTSGLIVVAKTARAHEILSDQFRARTVFKSYAALVHGATKEDKGKIEQPLGRDPRHRTRMGVVRGGRAALTLWRVRRRYERFTLLDVEIKTGRTHQIRVHLAWIKHPVVGDETYGMGRDKTIADPRLRAAIAAMGRQFLHAARLGFHHPRTGVWVSFDAPPPPELARLLEELEAKR
ncbi:MAG TPA: RluA family pseudouridine synthase, partial [Pyrinomonadaceae bacterium]|nr:RluA family pseudouridine synthase [Pyrinomonadaceae bacterium]